MSKSELCFVLQSHPSSIQRNVDTLRMSSPLPTHMLPRTVIARQTVLDPVTAKLVTSLR
jgi:hypothetical protein